MIECFVDVYEYSREVYFVILFSKNLYCMVFLILHDRIQCTSSWETVILLLFWINYNVSYLSVVKLKGSASSKDSLFYQFIFFLYISSYFYMIAFSALCPGKLLSCYYFGGTTIFPIFH